MHGRCGCSNETALVIMLKGADPLYQLDLRADPPCIKRYRPGTHASCPCSVYLLPNTAFSMVLLALILSKLMHF